MGADLIGAVVAIAGSALALALTAGAETALERANAARIQAAPAAPSWLAPT